MDKEQSKKNDFERLLEFLSFANQKVKDNTVIVSSDELPQPFLLHITGEKKPTYIPRIGHRQEHSEDRTMPRVTAAPSLLGCILGYGALFNNYIYSYSITSKPNDVGKWKGGLYIQKLPFSHCLKPNSKLVYDQAATDEHWLVPYQDELREFKTECIGKIIVESLTIIPGKKEGDRDCRYTILVQVDEALSFSDGKMLTQGQYRISFTNTRRTTWKEKNISITPIDKGEFLDKKKLIAANLSADNKRSSIYHRW